VFQAVIVDPAKNNRLRSKERRRLLPSRPRVSDLRAARQRSSTYGAIEPAVSFIDACQTAWAFHDQF